MDIKNRVRRSFDDGPDAVLIHPSPPHGPVIEHDVNALFAEWSVLLGEATDDFRFPLDYFIDELKRLDSGRYGSGLSFPSKTPEDFARKRRTYVRGISDEHIRLTEEIQPYRPGGHWTRNMQILSNRIFEADHRKRKASVAPDNTASGGATLLELEGASGISLTREHSYQAYSR